MIRAQCQEVRVGQREEHAVAADDPNHGEGRGIVEAQGFQQNAVDHGEHGGGGADPQRERGQRDGHEPGLAAQRAGRETEILEQLVHASS